MNTGRALDWNGYVAVRDGVVRSLISDELCPYGLRSVTCWCGSKRGARRLR